MTARHGRSAGYLSATMGHSSARTHLTYYVSIYSDEPRQAVLDVERWIGSEAARPNHAADVKALESRVDYRHTAEDSVLVA